MLTTADWHARFQQQASWTREVRNYLYQRMDLNSGKRILEIGCGSGAITTELSVRFKSTIHGADSNLPFLELAHATEPDIDYLCADACALPYASSSFDVVVCHFFLLWIQDIPAVLKEMMRISKPGGQVAALAEPDFGGRIDFPDDLLELGQWQTLSLRNQGANPNVGRRLMKEFILAGFVQVESGLLGGQWSSAYDRNSFDQEWKIIKFDLGDLVSPSRLESLYHMDEAAYRKGERILFVPTFYAHAQIAKTLE